MEKNIIWLDPNIFGEENKIYYKELQQSNAYKIKLFKTVKEAMQGIYQISYKNYIDVFIIVSGSLFPQFYNEFKTNLARVYMYPKIIIFTLDENRLKNSLGKDQNIINDKYYNIGGVKTNFKEVKEFIDHYPQKKTFSKKTDEDNNLNFYYVDTKDKLFLLTFIKNSIKFIKQDNQFYIFLCKNYYNKSKEAKIFLDSYTNLSDVPIEILARFYMRIYLEESSFSFDLNQNLREGKLDIYLSYIKVLYEGINLKVFPYLGNSEIKFLYRGTQLPDTEIKKIINNIGVKKLPRGLVFSNIFLSFFKNISVAKVFMEHNQKENFSKVLFILNLEDIYIDNNTSTNIDLRYISNYPEEEEILFLPFSAFKIESIEKQNDIYKIDLRYLANSFQNISSRNKSCSDIKKEILDSKPTNIEENSFNNLKFLTKSDTTSLINIEDRIPIKSQYINSINTSKLIEKYNSYRIDIKLNPDIKRTQYIIHKIQLKERPQNPILSKSSIIFNADKNYITGNFIITERDLNQNIRIINSFEESKRRNNYIKVQNELQYYNEKEIMDKCEIEINGNKLKNFTYLVKFQIPGEYKINYKFKSQLNRINYMFAGCTKLKHLNLKNFYSKDVTNMSCMFMQCISLEVLNLDNLDTSKVNDMSGIFYGCESLTYLDLFNFNTQNVENMSFLFFGCKRLFDVNLSRFITQNVKNMYSMFSGCTSLNSLYLLNFNTQNVINMTLMFSNCQSLKELNLSNFYTNKVQYMNNMFSGCSSLSKLDISNFNVENIINLDDMFKGCISLRIENINCKIKNILIKTYPFNY